ncbi:MAG: hypothetical protein J7M08_06875 [Planctomycetes bacterium]|nr:hypothetical protein [Planctomycetota bacterium]
MHLNYWDITLLLVVAVQATLLAYVPRPRTKALLLTLPFPFSAAYLALGEPVDATNMFGLALLLLFMHGVRWLHVYGGWHIVVAIVGMALAYGLVGSAAAHVLPRQEWMFWTACAAVLGLGAVLLRLQPRRDEPPHRSPLPVAVKLPLVTLVVACLILAKHWLRGSMTVFPMVSLVAAYEARHSLWTMSRQVPVIMLTLGSMIIAIHLAQPHFGPYGALAIGWLVFAGALPVAGRLRELFWREGSGADGMSEKPEVQTSN